MKHLITICALVVFSSVFFFCVSPGIAAEINVEAGDNAIANAVAAASAGDVLVLVTDGGVYNDGQIVIDKDLTIKSADGLVSPPILNFDTSLTDSVDFIILQANLILENLILDGNNASIAGHIIETPPDLNLGKIVATGCEFRDANRAMQAGSTTVDTLIIDNCLFHHHAHNVVNFRGSTAEPFKPGVRYARITNSTFYANAQTKMAVFISSLGGDSALVHIDHITVDDFQRAVNLEACQSASYVKNSAISNTSSNSVRCTNAITGVFVDYCNFFNSADPKDCVVGDNIFKEDPGYPDPANGDFTLSESSPLLGKADDGTAIGDPRWDPSGTAVENRNKLIVKDFALQQNYPNPFNPSTNIVFTLPNATEINLAVFNLKGEQIAVLANSFYSAGTHSIHFNASDLTAGVYFYKLSAAGQVQVRKMVLTK